ncbi:hypothetical protein IQ06DRAFT_351555 [Phaeosphaeriaceae sp. SRC1lsM3a]|nr:hypothetical protein IQ06DRAFT_351555 [Stagonospora sp. SRC1lsM3a]
MKPFALITAITATAALLAAPVLAASDPPKLNIGRNYLKCTNMRENLVKCGRPWAGRIYLEDHSIVAKCDHGSWNVIRRCGPRPCIENWGEAHCATDDDLKHGYCPIQGGRCKVDDMQVVGEPIQYFDGEPPKVNWTEID